MFKKPFKVKSNTQLKGSDRKKFKNELQNNFPAIDSVILSNIIPNKESMFVVKAITHSEQVIRFFCVQNLPIVFEYESKMYPTVYFLWHFPELLYNFTTHPEVFPVIAGGADLMIAGVVKNDFVNKAHSDFQAGERVSINLTNNKASIAIGKTLLSSHGMRMAERQGKCVKVLHCYGDYLSNFGQKLPIPDFGSVFEVTNKTDLEKFVKIEIGEFHLHNLENGKISCGTYDDIKLSETIINSIECTEDTSENVICLTGVIENKEPENTMDELILNSFLKTLKTTTKKTDLPLLTSNFYKLHMIASCPPSLIIDLKKSSYKKLSKFLDKMVDLGIIKIQTVTKGVLSISEINFEHDLIKQFEDPWSNYENPDKSIVDPSTVKQAPEIVEKYVVTAAVLPLLELYDYKKKDTITSSVVRKAISDYVKRNQLQDTTNRKNLILNDLLRNIVGEPYTTTSVPWDEFIPKVLGKMGQSFKVELGNNETKISKGKLQPINITVGTRSGNKKVTMIDNLDFYGINVQEFSKECQHGVAASTTINVLPHLKSPQVQVQGNQVLFIGKLLMDKYSIPKKYIRGLENAPKKKK
uniref:Uncharacterized protein n=1 Tax=Clastoptera arizonana TaxID=38151 RepID=A0A1B6CUD5_9HEMI